MSQDVLPPAAWPGVEDSGTQGPIVDLWSRDSPRSLINIVPERVASLFIEAGKARPELFDLDERALKKVVSPTPTDCRLRLAFWLEYDRAQSLQKPMVITNVFAGVCPKQYWEERWLRLAPKVAWLLCMPHTYEVVLEESLAFGLERMRDILDIEPIDLKGRPNLKLMELQTKVFYMLDLRKRGAYTQRVENKNLSLNVHTSDKMVAQQIALGSMEEIEARLKYLEKRERQALNLPVIEPEKPAEVTVDAEISDAEPTPPDS